LKNNQNNEAQRRAVFIKNMKKIKLTLKQMCEEMLDEVIETEKVQQADWSDDEIVEQYSLMFGYDEGDVEMTDKSCVSCEKRICASCGNDVEGISCEKCFPIKPKKKGNPFKSGDKVRYRDGDKRVFVVHTIYSPTKVSLGLAKYPDTEQDSQTDIKDIELVTKKGGKKK